MVEEVWVLTDHQGYLLRRGKMGLGSTKNIVDRLVQLGVVKKLDKTGRTIRPVYINFRHLK